MSAAFLVRCRFYFAVFFLPAVFAAGAAAPAFAMAFAKRDFLRAALFGWMMPFCAALSNCASTDLLTSASCAETAFLYTVFKRVLTSRLRWVRLPVCRTHLTAALMLGTNLLSLR